MTVNIDFVNLDIEIMFPFSFKFTCPRCDSRRIVVAKDGNDLDSIHCTNEDCFPSDRNLSFDMLFAPDGGWYQGILDSPVTCRICSVDYDYQADGDDYLFRPMCDCKKVA